MAQIEQVAGYPIPQINQVGELQGYPQAYPPQVNFIVRPDQVVLTNGKKHNNIFPAMMSLLVPGSGQIVEGDGNRGIKQLAIAGVLDGIVVGGILKAKSLAKENNLASAIESVKAGIRNVTEKESKEALETVIKKTPHSFGKMAALIGIATLALPLAACVHLVSSYSAYKGSNK